MNKYGILIFCLILPLQACNGEKNEALPGNAVNLSNPQITVYSARNQGLNVIPVINNDDEITGCEIVRLDGGPTQTIDKQSCRAFVKNPTRPPGPSCQVLLDTTDFIDLNPELCLLGTDDSATRAATAANQVMEYYSIHHNRKDLNGTNDPIASVPNIGIRYNNAFFSPEKNLIAYGDGDGIRLRDLTYEADVTGHELTHAVIDATAALVYQNESGALSEGFADFFGKLSTTPGDWTYGKEIRIDGKPDRDIAKPSNCSSHGTPYPSHMDEFAETPEDEPCDEKNDNCNVHLNSTIMSHAAYLLFMETGQEKSEKILYLALTQYFTATTDFQEAADAILLACQQLYSTSTCNAVSAAYSSVGLPPTTPQ